MNETQFGNRIRHLLNQGIHSTQPPIAARLAQARERALAHQRREPTPVLEWADNVTGGWSGFALRIVLPFAMLALSASVVYTWQQKVRAAEVEEIDAQLLTDDLPLDAFLDRGFQSWLKKQAEEE